MKPKFESVYEKLWKYSPSLAENLRERRKKTMTETELYGKEICERLARIEKNLDRAIEIFEEKEVKKENE